MSKLRAFEEFEKVYRCDCMGEFLRVNKFKDEENIYIGKLYGSKNLRPNFFERLKLAVLVVFKYRDTCLDDVILSRVDARELGEDLMKITSKHSPDLEMGKSDDVTNGAT